MSWIETDRGERAFKVSGKALRVRKTLVFEASREGKWHGSRTGR